MVNNVTYCTQVGHRNPFYCGITQQWVPRLTKTATIAFVVFPCFFSLLCTGIGIPLIWRNFDKLGLFEKEKQSRDQMPRKRWIPKLWYKYCIHVSVYVSPIVPLIWDSVDVCFDGLYFYSLEQGGLISSNITRNIYVNNSIIAYAIVGALKTPLLVLIIGRFWEVLFTPTGSDFTYKMVALSPRAIGNLYVSTVIYITEDCAESFLEYFWIEKYISDHPSSTIVIRNIFKAVVSFLPLVSQLFRLKDRLYVAEQIDNIKQKYQDKKNNVTPIEREPDGQKSQTEAVTLKIAEEKTTRQKIFICWVSLSVISIMSSIGSFLRAIGAVHQLIYHKIPESCLYVTNEGLLYQSPMEDNCLRFLDYSIIFFNFLPLSIYSLVFLIYMTCVWYYKLCLLNCFQYPNQANLIQRQREEVETRIIEGRSGKESRKVYKIIIEAPEQCHIIVQKSQGQPQGTNSKRSR